ncbi:MAG: hypothetical protein IPO88_28030 [Nannocystis sp.]|uniref:hypothetical protein n=1 Tax=Nannocystis sp. TaxID=1962667 RepID=UPI002420C7C1|nr:hypothetical protein [Nannocystis sp.]MBK9757278.1 hypothetical protein [Nannocystis sp.]
MRALGPVEAEGCSGSGVSLHEVVSVLLGEALAADEPWAKGCAGADPERRQRRRIELLAEHLEAFELALLRYDPDPYRGS